MARVILEKRRQNDGKIRPKRRQHDTQNDTQNDVKNDAKTIPK